MRNDLAARFMVAVMVIPAMTTTSAQEIPIDSTIFYAPSLQHIPDPLRAIDRNFGTQTLLSPTIQLTMPNVRNIPAFKEIDILAAYDACRHDGGIIRTEQSATDEDPWFNLRRFDQLIDTTFKCLGYETTEDPISRSGDLVSMFQARAKDISVDTTMGIPLVFLTDQMVADITLETLQNQDIRTADLTAFGYSSP